MARLTERYESGGTAMIKGCGDNCKYGCRHCTNGGDIGDCGTIDDVVDKLASYEDAEEQGLLLKLHLKVGDTVYYVISTMKNPIDFQIEKIEIFQDEIIYVDDGDNEWRAEDFGKLIFLTKEDAEKALADMGV